MGLNSELDQYQEPAKTPTVGTEANIVALYKDVSGLYTQTALLQESINSVQESNHQLASMLIEIKEHMTKNATRFGFGGFTFELQSLGKQDAVISGENKVGRDGVQLVATDGERKYTLAKMSWDHNKQCFVLYTGTGVAG